MSAATATATDASSASKTYNRNFIQENGVQCLSSTSLRENEETYVSEVVDTFNRVVPFHADVTKKPYRAFIVNFPWRLADNDDVWNQLRKLRFFDHLSVEDPKEAEKPADKRKPYVAPADEPALVAMWVPGMLIGRAVELMREWGMDARNITYQHTTDYSRSYYMIRENEENADDNGLFRVTYDIGVGAEDAIETQSVASDGADSEAESGTEETPMAVSTESDAEAEADTGAESDADSASVASSSSAAAGTDGATPRRKKARKASAKRRDNVEYVGANIPPADKPTFFRTSFMGLVVGYRGKHFEQLFANVSQSHVAQPVSSIELTNANVAFWKQMQEVQEPNELRRILKFSLARDINVLELFNSSETAMNGPFDLVGINCPGIYFTTKTRREKKTATDLTTLLFLSIVKKFTGEVLEQLKVNIRRILSRRTNDEERRKSKMQLFSILVGETDATLETYLNSLPEWKEKYQPLFGITVGEIETSDRLGFYKALECAIHAVSDSKYILKRMKPETSAVLKSKKKAAADNKPREVKPAGFMLPQPISHFLAEFLSQQLQNPEIAQAERPAYPCTEIVHAVSRYNAEHGLKFKDEADGNRSKIRIDNILSYLFNVPIGTAIPHGALQNLYRDHYAKVPTPEAAAFFNIPEGGKIFMREAMADVVEYAKTNGLYAGECQDYNDTIRLDRRLADLFRESDEREMTWAEFRQLFDRLIIEKEKPEKKRPREKIKRELTTRRVIRVSDKDEEERQARREKAKARADAKKKAKAEAEAQAQAQGGAQAQAQEPVAVAA